MSKLLRTRRLVPAALVAAASAVALASSPASAATIAVTVASQAIPKGAGCVWVTDLDTDSISDATRFSPGGSATISGMNIEAGDTVEFDWRASDCGPTTIRSDFRTTPEPLPTVWNVN